MNKTAPAHALTTSNHSSTQAELTNTFSVCLCGVGAPSQSQAAKEKKEEGLKQKTKKGNGTLPIPVDMPINPDFYQTTRIFPCKRYFSSFLFPSEVNMKLKEQTRRGSKGTFLKLSLSR